MTHKNKTSWFRGMVVSMLSALVIGFAAFSLKVWDVVTNRSFDTTQQKHRVLEATSQTLTGEQVQIIMSHVENDDIHMSLEEKIDNAKVIENQGYIGQDLESLKNDVGEMKIILMRMEKK